MGGVAQESSRLAGGVQVMVLGCCDLVESVGHSNGVVVVEGTAVVTREAPGRLYGEWHRDCCGGRDKALVWTGHTDSSQGCFVHSSRYAIHLAIKKSL